MNGRRRQIEGRLGWRGFKEFRRRRKRKKGKEMRTNVKKYYGRKESKEKEIKIERRGKIRISEAGKKDGLE